MKIWDSDTGTEITTLTGHTSRVNGISISKDGKYVASVSDDQTIRIWDPLAATEIATLIGHAGPVRSSAFSPKTKQIVTTSDDKTVKVWDVGIGEEKSGNEEEPYTSFAFSSTPTEKKAVTIAVGNLQGHSGWINDVRLAEGGDRLISVSDDASFVQWDLQTLEKLRTVRRKDVPDRAFKACDMDSTGTLAVTASDDGVVILWDLRARKKVRDVYKHDGPATSCSFSADGSTVISTGWDKKVVLCDARKDSSVKKTLLGHEDWILSSAQSSDGQTVISGGWDKTVNLWSVSTGAVKSKLTGHTHTVTSVAVSSDNRFCASASYDSTVKLWSTGTGKLDKIFAGHHGHVNRVAFTPRQDNSLLTAGSDHTVKLWDLARGDLKNEFVCQGPVTAVHALRSQRLLMAFGDSIGNIYFAQLQTDANS